MKGQAGVIDLYVPWSQSRVIIIVNHPDFVLLADAIKQLAEWKFECIGAKDCDDLTERYTSIEM